MPPERDLAAGLPDELPGQSNCVEAAPSHADAAVGPAPMDSPASLFGGVWNSANPAVSGLSLGQPQLQVAPVTASQLTAGGAGPLLPPDWMALSPSRLPSLRPAGAKPALNEVVCGTLMLAYERAGLWEQVEADTSAMEPAHVAASVIALCESVCCLCHLGRQLLRLCAGW